MVPSHCMSEAPWPHPLSLALPTAYLTPTVPLDNFITSLTSLHSGVIGQTKVHQILLWGARSYQ